MKTCVTWITIVVFQTLLHKYIVFCSKINWYCSAIVLANPPMVMVGIVPEHDSYQLIKESGEFVINIPTKGFEKEYYYLGSKSGRDKDKFAALNLEWENVTKVNAPLLSACPLSVECKVTTL